jgi:hypothetical protein
MQSAALLAADLAHYRIRRPWLFLDLDIIFGCILKPETLDSNWF